MSGRGPVLFVVPSLAVGGTERHVVRLATACQTQGPGAVVLCTRAGGSLAADLAAVGVPVVVLGIAAAGDPRLAIRIGLAIRRHRPSVVHAFLQGFDVVAALPARLLGVGLVLGSRRELTGWMRGRHRLIQAAAGPLVDAVVCCAEAVAREVVASEPIGGAPGAVVVIRNGVDLVRFRPDPEVRRRARLDLGLGPSQHAVVTIANFDREKGHACLLEAIRLLDDRPSEVRFLWAGDGPLRPAMVAAAGDEIATGRVQLLGPVGDVAPLLAAADLFVLASLSEGLPNAILEALAAGVAVVATRVGGVGEVIEHDRQGLLVTAGDPKELAAALRRALADPLLRTRLGGAARARAEAEFGVDGCVAAQLALYRTGFGATPSGVAG